MTNNGIRILRKKMKKTMVRLSQESGVSYSNLCRIEKGYKLPSVQTAEKIATALNVMVSDLYPGVILKDLLGD